jgi:hypothetical protein
MGLAIWSRDWIGPWSLLAIALVVAWLLINPRVFPPIRTPDNWMSQGVLGERVVTEKIPYPEHHRPVLRVLLALSLISTAVFALGLAMLDWCLTLLGGAAAIILKFWFVDRCVWIYQDVCQEDERVQAWTSGPANASDRSG